MNQFKTLVINRFNTFTFLTACVLLSVFLLTFRIKLTHSFFLIFMVWNLFLAMIPYTISLYLENKKKTTKLGLVVYSGIWLLFLPNAPYMVTDFVHLKLSTNNLAWLDFTIIGSFAFTGLAFYFLSINDMLKTFSRHLKSTFNRYVLYLLFLLSGFGVYFGRFLRYNSWEILQNPIAILNDIVSIAIHPFQNLGAWLFTLCFSLLLFIGYTVFNSLYFKGVQIEAKN